MKQRRRQGFEYGDVRKFVDNVFEGEVHAKRVSSLAGATTGVLASGSLAISAIGLGLAHVRGTATKHAVKQVDRLVGNAKVDVWECFPYWVPHIISSRKEIMVSMDLTEFDRDGHSTIALNLMTKHGRATPLVWLTVHKNKLKNNRNTYEDYVLWRLQETLPEGVKVTIVADRGFMDTALLDVLTKEMKFGYIIRLRGNVHVTSSSGEVRAAAQWVGKGGRAKTLRDAKLTAKEYPVSTVVCVQDKEMKEI